MKETLKKIEQTDSAIRNLFLMLDIGFFFSKKSNLELEKNPLTFFNAMLTQALKTQFSLLKPEDFSFDKLKKFIRHEQIKKILQRNKNENSNELARISTFNQQLLVLTLFDLIRKKTTTYDDFSYDSNPITSRFSQEITNWEMNINRENILLVTQNLQNTTSQILRNPKYVEKEPQNVLSLGHFVANILENNQ